ncbi:MAG: hypothetical protein GC139_01420 [Sideroxydans sp.]|nr:hypothetical protein [Sideroxydans sp.]
MVDEAAFRKALHSADPQACPFGKAILARCCACSLSRKRAIAEREAVNCAQPGAREQCVELYESLRSNSLFALKLVHADAPLTHMQNMKIQCGGLHGLQLAVDESDEVADVAALVAAALHQFGSLEQLPYSQVIQSVAAFQLRKPHSRE